MDTQLYLLPTSDMSLEDDATLDGWLASMTPDQFDRVLDALARSSVERSAAAS